MMHAGTNRIALAGFCLALQLFTGAAGAQHVQSAEVTWAGTYRVAQAREVDEPSAPTGRRYISSGAEPLSETEQISATIGTRFGVGFVLRGAPPGQVVPYRVGWRYPPKGLTNPETRTTLFEWRSPPYSCAIDQPCFAGYPLQHPWELLPGAWTIEIWVEGRKVVERTFELELP